MGIIFISFCDNFIQDNTCQIYNSWQSFMKYIIKDIRRGTFRGQPFHPLATSAVTSLQSEVCQYATAVHYRQQWIYINTEHYAEIIPDTDKSLYKSVRMDYASLFQWSVWTVIFTRCLFLQLGHWHRPSDAIPLPQESYWMQRVFLTSSQ